MIVSTAGHLLYTAARNRVVIALSAFFIGAVVSQSHPGVGRAAAAARNAVAWLVGG